MDTSMFQQEMIQQDDFEGVFVLYFWKGYVQNEDPGKIR